MRRVSRIDMCQMGMEDGDTVDVLLEQIGGACIEDRRSDCSRVTFIVRLSSRWLGAAKRMSGMVHDRKPLVISTATFTISGLQPVMHTSIASGPITLFFTAQYLPRFGFTPEIVTFLITLKCSPEKNAVAEVQFNNAISSLDAFYTSFTCLCLFQLYRVRG